MATTIVVFIVSALFFFGAFKANELIPWRDTNLDNVFAEGYGAHFLITITLFICGAFTGIVTLICIAALTHRTFWNV